LLLTRERRGTGRDGARRERPATEEDSRLQAGPDAFQRSNRLSDGDSAEVRWSMKTRRTISMIANALTAMLLAAPFLLAQDQGSSMPRTQNVRVEKRALVEPLSAEMAKWSEQAARPQWIAYAVARIPGDREMCCENYQSSRGNSGCGT